MRSGRPLRALATFAIWRCSRRTLRQIGAKVAHELKNPLAAIQGLVQLLARNAEAVLALRGG